MEKTAKRILRSGDVELKGQIQLTPSSSARNAAGPQTPVQSNPNVRILESNDDFAVVEFVCSCGQKTHVKCQYAPAKSG